MKKKLALLVLALAGLSAFAGTCIVQNVAWTEIDGDFHYGAELKNDTGADFLQHKFLVAFVEDGELLEEVTVEGCLRSLQAGAVNFYSTHTEKGDPDDIAAISRLKWEDGLKGGEVSDGDLELSNVVVERNGNLITVTGTMKNHSNDDYNDARACAVVYNRDGEVVRVEFSNEVDLNNGASANFDIEVRVPSGTSDARKVSVWADALNDDDGNKPIEPVSKTGIAVTTCPTATPTVTGTPPTNTPTNTATATSTPATPTNTSTPGPCQ